MDNKEIKEKLEEIETIKKVRELAGRISDVKVATLTTITAEGHSRSRPMQTHPINDDGIVWFIASKSSRKAAEILVNPHVTVSYSVPGDNLFVSIYGIASITNDLSKISELWSEMFRAWFPKGVDDPDIALIRVDINQYELWDAPDTIVSQLISVVKATLAGNPYAVGENKKVDI